MEGNRMPISWLLGAFDAFGLDRLQLLDWAKIPTDRVTEEEESFGSALVTLEEYSTLFRSASRTLEDPAIGLAVLDHVTSEDMGLLGLLTRQGPTLRRALLNLATYQPIFSSLFQYALESEQSQDRLVYRVDGARPESCRHDIELSLGFVSQFAHNHFPLDSGIESAEFAFSAPEDLSRYIRVFGENISFNRDRNTLCLNSYSLDRPLPGTDERLSAILETQAKRVLDDLADKPQLVRRVEAILALGLGQENLSIEKVASGLFMHPRTLHRRLIQYGTSFRQLKDNIVTRSAQDALLQTEMSVTEIAIQLGYSENSAFTRTFKRVCDVSPSQYRKLGREHI